ncbi:7 transmembrane receptor (secretin family) protein (macronuclear) [Tetrahymena thermophila SB210]|uniref:7 transmembrane receptor (Secretin family) protein n=1 Tax=Tetrahymena thermophila (strain SB210) TaxID=312017 RepID=Q24HN4_TETTS|nr:7 transmembrane receptor (secretin family) protein [Tetrahymena thermophila SB210]EAS07277.1 7 transmembrane receptor (secretin family) protein [Tetrahymena thermophila SB210]|eukprot:XP_001027519.1 7 transmembrane receptor (secretin family) protein [Tetrahymena thermophila SB210]
MGQTDVFEWIIFGESVISLILSILVIFAYFKFKKIKSFPFKLIMLLCVADSFNSLAYFFVLFHVEDNYNLCQVQGFFIQYSNVSSFVVTSVIALNVLLTIVYNRQNPEKYTKYYLFVSFVIPLIIAVIPAIAGKYKNEAPFYCWLDQKDYSYYVVFAFVFFYGVLWVSVLFFIFCLIRVYRYIKFVGLERPAAQFYKKLLNFPVIMMICWLPSTINRIIDWFNEDYSTHQWTYFMHICFDILASILNVCIYGFNEQVRREFRRYFFSRQGVEDYTDLDEQDNRKKLLEHPKLQKLNIDSSRLRKDNELGSPSDIAFFMNEDDDQLGYNRINRANQQSDQYQEINFSAADES